MRTFIITFLALGGCATTDLGDEADTSIALEGNGCTRGQMFVDRNGADIWLVGRHQVHFYNDARYAYDTHE
jgi:hypothetical protein